MFPLSIPKTFKAYSLSSNNFFNSASYFVAHILAFSYTSSAVIFDITVFDTSNNLTISNNAPLTLILFNCNSNSSNCLSGLALLQFSKLEFAIFNKYSLTASAGIPSSA